MKTADFRFESPTDLIVLLLHTSFNDDFGVIRLRDLPHSAENLGSVPVVDDTRHAIAWTLVVDGEWDQLQLAQLSVVSRHADDYAFQGLGRVAAIPDGAHWHHDHFMDSPLPQVL